AKGSRRGEPLLQDGPRAAEGWLNVAFDSFTPTKTSWLRRTLFIGSIVFHAGAAIALLIWSVLHVEELPPPEVTLTFFNAAPPPRGPSRSSTLRHRLRPRLRRRRSKKGHRRSRRSYRARIRSRSRIHSRRTNPKRSPTTAVSKAASLAEPRVASSAAWSARRR